MACCLSVPRHHRNQCWLLTRDVLWTCTIRSSSYYSLPWLWKVCFWNHCHLKAISPEMLKISLHAMSLKSVDFRIHPHLSGTNELTCPYCFMLPILQAQSHLYLIQFLTRWDLPHVYGAPPGPGLSTNEGTGFAPSQWETSLQSNAVSHWLGANLESALRHPWIVHLALAPRQPSYW